MPWNFDLDGKALLRTIDLWMAKAMKLNSKPPFDLSQKVVNNLILLQRRDIEFDGFIKGDNLLHVRRGTYDSVESEIIPDGDYDFSFHTHPTTQVGERDYGSKKLNKREFKCSAEKELLASKPLSASDVHHAIHYQKGLPSLMVWEHGITLHHLEDEAKWNAFKGKVKQTIGDDKEKDVAAFLEMMSNKIHEEETNRVYDEKQNFSMCGERDVWKRGDERWNEFFKSIGVKLDDRPVKYKESSWIQ